MQQGGEVTLPGRKLLDIIRALPEKAQITIGIEGERATVRSGKSRFTLTTLPATDFPTVEDIRAQQSLIRRAVRAEVAAGQDPFFDGAAGRALLPEWHVAGNRR